MCWKSSDKPILKIAREDIPVFKIACYWNDNVIESYYAYFKYEIGINYSERLEILQETISDSTQYFIINKGFHSYSYDCTLKICQLESNKMIAVYVYSKSSRSLLDCYNLGDIIKANCIIPKGAFYYVNSDGEYVSDQIKIINYDVLEK